MMGASMMYLVKGVDIVVHVPDNELFGFDQSVIFLEVLSVDLFREVFKVASSVSKPATVAVNTLVSFSCMSTLQQGQK